MSEKISLKDLMPNEFYINDIGLMCCELSLKEVNNITSVLTNLQQENQQLKEALENLKEINNDKSNLIVDDIKEILKYKSVLDEIREYIDKEILGYRDYKCTKPVYVKDDEIGKDLLQILDKVKE